MNRARKVSRLWQAQRPKATRLASIRQARRNEKRKPRPPRDPNKI